ncbi:hypothetical protein B0H14DRAFT_2640216 [Mycena olivaceomarginata]|nr:hypothetical protein B0H14DRAFT_2640216 [Mycena olivaceomarginata]
MADVLELETDSVFDPSQWIGVGRIYKDVPIEVSDACSAAFRMPVNLQATFPSPDLPVTEFLAINLPGNVADLKKMPGQTDSWFSSDVPNCDLTTGLWAANSIPPHSFLRELENDCAQKWLNGAKSILDSSNKTLRLPLFALPFYRKIHELQEAQNKWVCGRGWVRDHLPGFDLAIFSQVSWNTLDWTRLLDDEWLSGGIIDTMMFDLQTRVAAIPALDAFVTVAPLAFQHAIIAFSMQERPSRYTRSLLKNYKDLVEIGKEILYFPLHVDGNHWIAFFIDFKRKAFGYGDSFGRKSVDKEFRPHLSSEASDLQKKGPR